MTPALAAAPSRPFPGIGSYQYQDHAIFFGRGQDAERLLRLVTIYRGALLFGGQGLGKSSLLNAALLPRAVKEGFVALRVRVSPEPGREIVAERISEVDEGKPPFLPSLLEFDGKGSGRRVLSCGELHDVVAKWDRKGYPLLIFDQFEEFVTLFEEAPKGDARRQAMEAQRAIGELIVSIWRDHRVRVKMLFSFREDYLAKLHKLFGQIPDLVDVTLRLSAIKTGELEELIRSPFQRFPGHFPKEISEALARKVAAAIGERSETGDVILSEVQTVCLQLLEAPDPDREFETKGVRGLLEEFLESALHKAGPSRAAAVALLNRLVTEEGLRNVVSEENLLTAVHKEDGFAAAEAREALGVLAGAQLIRRERREDVVFYSIISEWIVPWIREQKAKSRLAAQRGKWVKLAGVVGAVGIFVAGIGLATAWYIYETRTENALANEYVQRERQLRERATLAASASELLVAETRARLTEAVAAAAALKQQNTQLQAASVEMAKKLQDQATAMAKLKVVNERLVSETIKLDEQVEQAGAQALKWRAAAQQYEKEAAQLRQSVQAMNQTIGELNRKLDAANRVAPLQLQPQLAASIPACPGTEVFRIHTGWVRTIRVGALTYYLYVRDVNGSKVAELSVFSTAQPWWKEAKFDNEKEVGPPRLKKGAPIGLGLYMDSDVKERAEVAFTLDAKRTLIVRNVGADVGADDVSLEVCLK